jgi:hypothetical protein
VTLSDATTKRRPPSAVHERLIIYSGALAVFPIASPAQIVWRSAGVKNIKGEDGGETSALRAME